MSKHVTMGSMAQLAKLASAKKWSRQTTLHHSAILHQLIEGRPSSNPLLIAAIRLSQLAAAFAKSRADCRRSAKASTLFVHASCRSLFSRIQVAHATAKDYARPTVLHFIRVCGPSDVRCAIATAGTPEQTVLRLSLDSQTCRATRMTGMTWV